MAVLMMLELQGGTLEQYERANELMGITEEDNAPERASFLTSRLSRRLYRDRGRLGESEALLKSLRGACRRLSRRGRDAEGEARIARVHNHIAGAGTESGVRMYLEIDELDADERPDDRRHGRACRRQQPSCGLARGRRDP